VTVGYNDLEATRDAFAAIGDRIACVIVEPVCGNAGFIPPVAGFLEGLREVTRAHDALLIFDEVMTGFRVGRGGAQQRFAIEPDLTTLGKVIGGGLPVGAYGGRADLMERVAPAGPVYQAGTLSGNPLAMAAGIAQMRVLLETDPWNALERRAQRFVDGLAGLAAERGLPFTGGAIGAMFGWFFVEPPVRDIADARRTGDELFARVHRGCLERGVLLAPSPFEASFLSTAHTDHDIDAALDAMRASLGETM
jgi:glutamate-1-semialdehyde 2,1-aminomutase